jgi:nitrous oxidase accessory protein NosD
MKKTTVALLILIAVLSVTQFESSNAEVSDVIMPIYINADGSIEPSTAPIQHSGNVYSLTDNIQNSNITIQCNNIILNGAGFSLQGLGENSSNLAAVSLTCTNVTVFNFTISDWNTGVLGVYDNNTIQSNIFSNNHIDVAVYANDYLITGNQIGPQRIVGDNVTVSKNQIILGDYQTGFWITNCTNLKIESNNVTFSKLSAFFISPQNSYFQIYHNNFLNVEVIDGGTLIFPKMDLPWDNGVEGNYWSDYKARYPQAVEIDNSGIGSIAYVSNLPPKVVTDRYPLMEPYNFDTPTPPEIPELNWTILPIISALTLICMIFVKSKFKNKPLNNFRRN